MVTFDAVVQDFHVCLTEHLVVKICGDDVWEHLLAIPMDTSSLTTREFSQSGLVDVFQFLVHLTLLKLAA